MLLIAAWNRRRAGGLADKPRWPACGEMSTGEARNAGWESSGVAFEAGARPGLWGGLGSANGQQPPLDPLIEQGRVSNHTGPANRHQQPRFALLGDQSI